MAAMVKSKNTLSDLQYISVGLKQTGIRNNGSELYVQL